LPSPLLKLFCGTILAGRNKTTYWFDDNCGVDEKMVFYEVMRYVSVIEFCLKGFGDGEVPGSWESV
jgi:hypothetical protein